MFGSDAGFWVSRRPDRVLSPDAAFVSRARLPAIPAGFLEGAPDFAVEVRSQSDAWSEVAKKCGIWISHGSAVVWGIDPFRRCAAEFRAESTAREIAADGRLSADPVLPGFSIALADLFSGF